MTTQTSRRDALELLARIPGNHKAARALRQFDLLDRCGVEVVVVDLDGKPRVQAMCRDLPIDEAQTGPQDSVRPTPEIILVEGDSTPIALAAPHAAAQPSVSFAVSVRRKRL